MPIEQKVPLQRFIRAGELLDAAFADPVPTPDYLAHQCELAELALLGVGARAATTEDATLAELFGATHRPA